MRRFGFVLPLLFLPFDALIAGQIYGTLRENGRGVVGARVEITPEGKAPISTSTRPDGGYSVAIPDSGRCVFRVYYKNSTGTASVSSYADPVKYDFDLIQQAGGLTLLRK